MSLLQRIAAILTGRIGAESPQDMRLGNGTDDIDLGDAHVEADPMEEGEEPEDVS